MDIYNIINSLGVFSLLLAYMLAVSNRIKFDNKTYHFLTLFGSILTTINTCHYKLWNLVILYSLWILLSICGILKKKEELEDFNLIYANL